MSRIDPSRIAEIFRALSHDFSKTSPNEKSKTHKQLQPTELTRKVETHNEAVLRQRLKKRLTRLSEETSNFSDLAPEVTIKEVLIWEFGETILNHPEFNSISKKVTLAVQTNENISFHLKNLINQLIDKS